jgi:hypothetical protein
MNKKRVKSVRTSDIHMLTGVDIIMTMVSVKGSVT